MLEKQNDYTIGFDKAMEFVFKWEGGLCEDKNDRGGITNYGVSLAFLKTVKPDATREDIINMTKDDAADLFYKNFWLPCHCDELPDRIAFVVFDTAVNTGVKQASKFLQRVIGVKDDGVIGKDTLAAVDEMFMDYEMSEDFMVAEYMKKRAQFYKDIVKKRPSQEVFLKGWLNRTSACTTTALGVC